MQTCVWEVPSMSDWRKSSVYMFSAIEELEIVESKEKRKGWMRMRWEWDGRKMRERLSCSTWWRELEAIREREESKDSLSKDISNSNSKARVKDIHVERRFSFFHFHLWKTFYPISLFSLVLSSSEEPDRFDIIKEITDKLVSEVWGALCLLIPPKLSVSIDLSSPAIWSVFRHKAKSFISPVTRYTRSSSHAPWGLVSVRFFILCRKENTVRH